MKKIISIIIPVYNGEKHINRCIDSVLKQINFDINNLEILLLNDGSTDDSLSILNEYSKKYPTIINVISHDNVGVAKTRNRGVDISIGEYIMFIDQDDFIDDDYCAIFYGEAAKNSSDVVIGGYKRPDVHNKIIYTSKNKDTEWRKYSQASVWAKIHKSSFIKSNNIKFYDGYGEDVVFSNLEYVKTNNIKQFEYTGYNWFYNNDSVSNTVQKKLDEKYNKKVIALLDTLSEVFGDNILKIQYQAMLYIGPGWILNCASQNSKADFIATTNLVLGWFKYKYPRYSNSYFFKPVGGGGSLKEIIGLSGYIFVYKLKMIALIADILCKRSNR